MTARQEVSLQQHPLSAAFPAMPENELGALALDIETHGQREPGVLFQGMVLDGWHRYRACEKVGVEFKTVEFNGDDPVAFVISRNLHRRHLTASQRAACVVATSEWRQAGRPEKGAILHPPSKSELAKAADVSERTIVEARRAQEVGLGDEVKAGKVSAHAASEVAKLPPAKRAKAVKAIKEGKAPPAEKKPKVIVAERKFEKLYEAVKAELTETKEKLDEVTETARELQDKLEMYETTEPDEQQKLIAELQKKVQRKDAEIQRQRGQISDLNNKCNALIRQVKSLQKGK